VKIDDADWASIDGQLEQAEWVRDFIQDDS
jgi:hypothetical protein